MAGEEASELAKVVDSLLKSLASRLSLPRQDGLSNLLVRSLARKLGLRCEGEVTLEALLARMKTFGIDLDHIEIIGLSSGDHLQQYFLLDLANVLLDSIEKVKQARTTTLLESKLEEAGGSSGGEEVARILAEARVKYGKIRSFREGLDQANISCIPVQKPFPVVLPKFQSIQSDTLQSEIYSQTSEANGERDHKLLSKAQPKPKRRKLAKDVRKGRKGKSCEKENKEDSDVTEEEINVNIPISDTTDVRVKVKPLDNKDVKNQRIHVRVNQKSPQEENKKSKSRHIVYGSKSVVSHHLRKSRPPMFSKKLKTPKLDRKQILEKAVNEVKRVEKQKEEDDLPNKEQDFNLHLQKVIRDKRTRNAQVKKLMKNLEY